jgi:hypothetical protein
VSPIVHLFMFVFVIIPLTIYLSYLAIIGLRRTKSGVKIIILGLHVTLIGGILVLDTDLEYGKFGYILVLLGFLLSLLALGKSSKTIFKGDT